MKIDRLHVVLSFGMVVALGASAYLAVAGAHHDPIQVAARTGPYSQNGSLTPSTEATARTILGHMYYCEVQSAQLQMAAVSSDVHQVQALMKREVRYKQLIQANRAQLNSLTQTLSESELLTINAANRQAVQIFSQDGLADPPLPIRSSP